MLMEVTNELISELLDVSKCNNRNKLNFALCKAINLFPNQATITKDWVIKKADSILQEEMKQEYKNAPITKTKIQKEVIEKTKSKRGRKALNRGKLILGGTKFNKRSFWDQYSIKDAKDNNFLSNAQPKDNYLKVKQFLSNEWKNVREFKLVDLVSELTKIYVEEDSYSQKFRIQRWHDAYYWSNCGEIAIKSLWKKMSRKECLNVFCEV